MRALNLIAFGAAISMGVLPTVVHARERDVAAAAPLARVKPDYLDKAKGIGPRFRFLSAPPELSLGCASSVWAKVNEGGFVDYPGARTAEEFRSALAGSVQLESHDAERAPIHTSFVLRGDAQTSGAKCGNVKAGREARGHCSGIISGGDYTIVYSFDPVACRYDNVAVANALQSRLSVGNRTDSTPEPDCETKLAGFVTDIDDVLAKNPRSIHDVHDVLNQHFPLHGCPFGLVYDIVSKSKYFRSVGMNGPKMHVFVLNSETVFSSGVAVSFGLTSTGDSSLPSARWSPPFW